MLALAHIQELLAAVIERASALLHARVVVLDERERILAASDPELVGLLWGMPETTAAVAPLRVPLALGDAPNLTMVLDLGSDEPTPLHVAHALVEMIVNEELLRGPLPQARQIKSQFVYNLLFTQNWSEGELLRQGHMLGIDLAVPRAVMLIDAAKYILQASDIGPSDSLIQRRANLVIASIVDYFRLPSAAICAYIGGGEVVVLKAAGAKDLKAWLVSDEAREQPSASWANLSALKRAARGLFAHLQRDIPAEINLGIGRYHPGVRGLSRSYQDARAALSLGRQFQSAQRVHCLDGLGVAAFVGVSEEQTKIDLAHHLLSPLDHELDLLETVAAFFAEDCSPSATSERLTIHRNTLTYRLDKVTSLTGLDPRHFDDAMQIYLALLLRSMQEAEAAHSTTVRAAAQTAARDSADSRALAQ